MTGAPHLTFDLEAPGVSIGFLVVPKGAGCEALSLPIFCLNRGLLRSSGGMFEGIGLQGFRSYS